MNSDRPIGVAGAGSIGCFVGGMLAAGGRRIALLARPRVIGEIEANGLRLTGFDGFEHRLAANNLTLSDAAICRRGRRAGDGEKRRYIGDGRGHRKTRP